MTVRQFQAEIAVTLESPFVMAGEAPARHGVDVAQLRDRAGRPLIPAAQIRGVARHGWEYLQKQRELMPGTADDAFGAEGGPVDRAAGWLVFGDLVGEDCPGARNGASAVTRVTVDDATGAAKEGHLLIIELAAPIGAQVTFRGKVRIEGRPGADAGAIAGALREALHCVIAIGRFKTVGFGRVVEAHVGEPTAVEETGVAVPDAGATLVDLSFTVDRPLMVDVDRPDANSLHGREVIPGAALKGALARQLRIDGLDPESGPLASALSRMVVGHAFPAVGAAGFGEATAYDQVRHRKPGGGLEQTRWHAPEPDILQDEGKRAEFFKDEQTLAMFKSDWKGGEPGAKRAFAYRVPRTRVAIDPGTGAQIEGRLFAQSAVAPVGMAPGGKEGPVVWTTRIAWPGSDQEPEFTEYRGLVARMAGGLHTLGKSKARTIPTGITAKEDAAIPTGAIYRVELRTAALLVRSCHLESDETFQDALRQYWGDLDFEIDKDDWGQPDIFTAMELRGGFAAISFRLFGDDRVEPFALMRPGSVFNLRPRHPAIAPGTLRNWLRHGLPMPSWVAELLKDRGKDRGKLWQLCPYVPENGYGAIRVSMK